MPTCIPATCSSTARGPGSSTSTTRGFGWHVHELAVALFNNQTSPHFGAMQAALIRGYRSRRELADEDLELLPLFLLMRNLMVIGWMEQRPEMRALYRRFRASVKASVLLRIEALRLG